MWTYTLVVISIVWIEDVAIETHTHTQNAIKHYYNCAFFFFILKTPQIDNFNKWFIICQFCFAIKLKWKCLMIKCKQKKLPFFFYWKLSELKLFIQPSLFLKYCFVNQVSKSYCWHLANYIHFPAKYSFRRQQLHFIEIHFITSIHLLHM